MAVIVKNNKLYLDFYWYLPGGKRKRFREATGLSDTKKNREILERKDRAIGFAIKSGIFDYLVYFPYGSQAKYFRRKKEDLLFSDWFKEFLQEKSVRPNTARGWDSAYRIHIEPHFGHYQISDIDDHEIMVFRKMIEGKGLKASTINDKIMKILCMSLYRAYKRGIIDKYPCQDIGRLEEARVDIDPFSFEDLRHFLEVMKEKAPAHYEMLFIWSRTGLRPGEICALKWDHVDYFTGKLMIRQTMLPSGTIGPPKTKTSVRDVDLRPQMIDALKRQEARSLLSGGYVFLTGSGRPFTVEFLRKKFKYWMKLAGMKYRSPKQMRHTFATLHLASGEQVGWVSRMMGHASPKITWDRYYRFIPNLTRDDGSAFEQMMNGKSNEKVTFKSL